jgi:hypothetical protein
MMPDLFIDLSGFPWVGQYILGGEDGRTPVPCPCLLEWAEWLDTADRCVAWTGNASKYVSTVFLGLDHRHFGGGPPLVFETILFIDGRPTGEMERYSSWDDAETGHKCFVRKYLVNQKTRVAENRG